jgi:hypothetical protein
VDRLHRVEPTAPLREVKQLQPAGRQIISDHRFGHVAPADSGKKQGVFRSQIKQGARNERRSHQSRAPCERRAVGENEFNMASSGSGRIRLTHRTRMARSRYGDKIDAADPNLLKSGRADSGMFGATNPDVSCAR